MASGSSRGRIAGVFTRCLGQICLTEPSSCSVHHPPWSSAIAWWSGCSGGTQVDWRVQCVGMRTSSHRPRRLPCYAPASRCRSMPPRIGEPRPGSYAATIISRVRAIPRGPVCTYGDIDPRAPRAVGRVLAMNYAHVPCHRVIRANGTAAMGLPQLERLRAEGVSLRGDRIDSASARARWDVYGALKPRARRGIGGA